MPRYGYGPGSFYEGSGFDPYSGYTDFGPVIADVIARIAGNKRKKQEEAWELEDRAWQEKQRALAEQGAGLDIAAKQREAKDYVSPMMREFLDRLRAKREHAQELERIKAQGEKEKEVAGVRGTGTDKPSDYDKKVIQANNLFKAGKITEQEYNRILTGYTGEETEKERKATRNRIASETRKAVDAGLSNKYHENPKDRDVMKSALGVDLAMPAEYNISKRMIESDVADDKDYDVVKKYEDLFRFYQEQLKPKMSLKQLMESAFYKGLDNALKAELVKWYRLKI